MTLNISRYKVEDFYAIKPQTEQLELYEQLYTTDIPKHLESCEDMYTLSEDDEIICIAGVIYQREGVGEVFTLMGTNFIKHLRFILRWYKGTLDALQLYGDYHRLQAVGKANWKVIPRWMKALGFQSEGIMKQWGSNKEDYHMFRRLKDGS